MNKCRNVRRCARCGRVMAANKFGDGVTCPKTTCLKCKEEVTKLNEKAKICKDAIKELPPKFKEVMIMREFDNMQYKEIAIALGRNESTIKSQIRRGRELVRDKVEGDLKRIDEEGLE